MKTIRLRNFEDKDIEFMKKWLFADHVAAWYHNPEDWLHEIEQRHTEFQWISHFIVEVEGNPVGFCQYYPYDKSGESWQGTVPVEGTYSIDYLIGEAEYLNLGYGKKTIQLLLEKLTAKPEVLRVIVQPEAENIPSGKTLLSAGFSYDKENNLYLWNQAGSTNNMVLFMCLGLSLGMVLGQTLFDNIALGMCFGMAIGMAIGSGLDMQAARKNK